MGGTDFNCLQFKGAGTTAREYVRWVLTQPEPCWISPIFLVQFIIDRAVLDTLIPWNAVDSRSIL
ncbi:6444_t:CDS:2 [Funneliformis caledonium]|uniref:6444_t:CDS:1 n=1 Tax=Funneliformis caledonium TaxID=1117310 RepID=A0A9N9A5X5_9GLOM|nr:6444_t:CDS:2 [Funneliformis caledonium]